MNQWVLLYTYISTFIRPGHSFQSNRSFLAKPQICFRFFITLDPIAHWIIRKVSKRHGHQSHVNAEKKRDILQFQKTPIFIVQTTWGKFGYQYIFQCLWKKTNIVLPGQISDLFYLDLLENPKFILQHFDPVFAILFIGTQLSNYSTTWSINKSCKCTAYNFYHRPECTVERSYEPSTNWKNKILYAPVITEKHVRMMYTCRFSSEMKYPFHRLHYKWE